MLPEIHLCNYCLIRLSLGLTQVGWLGCIECQTKVGRAVSEFLREKFGR